MARKAREDEHGAPNVVSLARARAAQLARRSAFHWPADGPSPERVALAALEASGGEGAVLAADGTVLAANRAWLLGAPACLPGTEWFSSWRFHELDPRDAAQVIPGVRATLRGLEPFHHGFRLSGTWVELVSVPLGGPVGGAVVTLRAAAPRGGDVPDGRDPLTGLVNRARLVERLGARLEARDGRHVAVLVVNIDDFKRVNQAYGHALGDQLLVDVARRLEAAAGADDVVAHLGGDEFAVLTASTPGSGDVAELAAALALRLAQPFRAGTRLVHLNANIGCRVADPALHNGGIELLRDAVAAMRDARRDPSGVAFFSSDTRARVVRRMVLENDLRLAVQFGGLTVAYQPQVDMATGDVIGAEALVRWRHDEYGQVAPSEFIPLAEATGLIDQLGAWVLREACREHARWKVVGHAPAVVTVNVSPRQLTDRLLPLVREVLAETGLAPHELCLELTETALMSSPEEGIDILRSIRSLGITIALDDFGTGHSSLGMLKALPVDVLKIDRSFVTGLGASGQDGAIVAAVLALAGALGLETVAEGVERTVQADRLLALGCRNAQGWLFAPALPGAELAQRCATGFPPVDIPQIDPVGADQAPMALPQEDQADE